MSFRDRRRRLLGDDSLATEPGEDRGTPDRGNAAAAGDQPVPRAYAAAARNTLVRPIRDYIPSRYGMIALVAIGGLVLVGILDLAHVWAQRLADVLGNKEVGVFDLNAAGNASGWLAAMLLALASLIAIFLYLLRRHRVDDYHGRYRVWIWTAIGCLAASLCETTSVAALMRALCRRAAAWSGLNEAVVWPSALGALLGLAGIRLLVEMRRCRAAAALLVLAALAFATAAATDHSWLAVASDVERRLLERGTWLAGYVLMLTALLTYARHVTLEIEGVIAVVPARPRKRKIKPADAPAETPADSPRKLAPNLRTDLDSTPRPSAAAPAKAAHVAAAPIRPAATNHASAGVRAQDQRPLSRAERKRLRREARMQS